MSSSVPVLRRHTLLDFGSYLAPAFTVADPLRCPAGAQHALSAVRGFFELWVWPSVARKFGAARQHEIFVRWLAQPRLVAVEHWQVDAWVRLAERDAPLP